MRQKRIISQSFVGAANISFVQKINLDLHQILYKLSSLCLNRKIDCIVLQIKYFETTNI